MTPKKGLSLCVVTCNDEKFISDCLHDLKGSVDELIVVDIGSSDQTIARAKHAGAHVFEYDWQESFSEVKNFCMDRALGRWILFLQANETLSDADLKKLPLLLKNPNVEGYLLQVALGGLKMISPNSRLRLIRNRKDYRFCYRAFEQIPDEQICNIENADIMVHSRDTESSWDIPMRNRLLEQDIAQHPTAHYIHYVRGLSFFKAEKFDESAVCFEKACENLNPECLFASHLFECRAWCLLFLERYSEALAVLDKAIECFPFYSDFLVLRAEINKQLGDYNAGISGLMQCLNTMKQIVPMVPSPEISAPVVWESLGIMMAHLANLHQALACFQQAYYLNSRNSSVFERLCALTPEADMPEALTGILSITLTHNIPRQLLAAAKAFFLLGQYDKALGLVSRISDASFDAQVRNIIFNCRLMMERHQTKDGIIIETSKGSSFPEQIKCCWLRNEIPTAEALLKEWAQADGMDSSLCAIYRMIQAQLSDHMSLASLTPVVHREIRAVHDMLLLNGQIIMAKKLLPVLLKQNQELLIELAVLWAGVNDFDTLKQIFEAITQEEVRAEFKYRVLRKLFHDGHLKTAEKLLNLDAWQPSEAMLLALWCARYTKRLEEIRRSVRDEDFLNQTAETATLTERAKPLVEFLEAVGDESSVDSKKTVLTCDEIQCQIGADFEKKQKMNEAMTAYLRALQWGPNQVAQDKICAFARQENGLESLLEMIPWTTEDGLFRCKDGFCSYICGLIRFNDAQLEQACALFEKARVLEPDSPACSYLLVSLWLQDEEEKASALFNSREASLLKKRWCISIFKNYILTKLEKALQQNQYNGLLLDARESVMTPKFLTTA
ncbi:MAG: hypothetical protein K0S22_495 [Oscillospiraceae bacterium]|jgi:tetratricopeptide (TPR) repeat protein|nr:hypothetical protein [Oscillospiraceae bacterium]